ncbi:AAA family ATPase [bacterium]|nr:AAA family ATPase [bacterium]
MIISKVNVTAFKSIKKLSFPLDKHVTVFIGPNESGKTNILRSMMNILPTEELTADKTCQYSDLYRNSKPPVISIELSEFTREERSKLAKIYDGFRSIDSFWIRREGQELSDYKIVVDDKILSIGNIKPLLKLMPKILYFDSISIINDRVSYDELVGSHPDFQTERNLLKIGDIDDPTIIFENSTRGRRAAEETGWAITKRLREVWTQEPSLEIKLRVNGNLMFIDFSDDTTVYDTPKSRSLGFLWYLSFYINFIATSLSAKSNSYLFLFDEPGLHLHPAGQKDLTQLMENLSQKNQIIYTTHSPFMINRNFPDRVRLVNKSNEGTTIDNEAYRENWRPLRQSIGLTVGDLFFFNTKGLFVEFPNKQKRGSNLFHKNK